MTTEVKLKKFICIRHMHIFNYIYSNKLLKYYLKNTMGNCSVNKQNINNS